MLNQNKPKKRHPRNKKPSGKTVHALALKVDGSASSLLSDFFKEFGYLEPTLLPGDGSIDTRQLLECFDEDVDLKLVDGKLVDENLLSDEWRSFSEELGGGVLMLVKFFVDSQPKRNRVKLGKVKKIN